MITINEALIIPTCNIFLDVKRSYIQFKTTNVIKIQTKMHLYQ